jgi:GT2 family glycosyltransferase
MMNDLVFNPKVDALSKLVEIADKNPKIGVLSPTEPNSSYINCKPKRNSDFHCVTTCDYLSLLVRAEAVNSVGFLNPIFKYCWGAIHEFSYNLYRKGWWVAYCDKVTMKHLGGTTYGTLKGIPSRQEYKRNASKFAAFYFYNHHGKDWDKKFSKVLPPEVKINAFPPHRKIWESMLSARDRKALHAK